MYVIIWGYDVRLDQSLIAAPVGMIRQQVREYEHGDRRDFDLDVRVPDSFTGAVMSAILTIPCGETRTYGEIATELDASPIGVGQACSNNPVPLVVPCHRVVGTDSLRGFRYPGLKEILLRHENEEGLERLGFELDGSI